MHRRLVVQLVLGLAVSAIGDQAACAQQPAAAELRSLSNSQTGELQTGGVQTSELGGAEDPAQASADAVLNSARAFHVESVTGRVVWYGAALDRLFGIKISPDAEQNTLAIELDDGRLLPLIDDLRATAFRKDDRLRAMQVELLVRRYEATPSLQVLKMFQIEDAKKYQLDYWCDICAIVMFERGACACCQDDNRLRKRLVEAP